MKKSLTLDVAVLVGIIALTTLTATATTLDFSYPTVTYWWMDSGTNANYGTRTGDTPNVVVTYGPHMWAWVGPSADSGYAGMVDVVYPNGFYDTEGFYNGADLVFTFTADYGVTVHLQSFDCAAYGTDYGPVPVHVLNADNVSIYEGTVNMNSTVAHFTYPDNQTEVAGNKLTLIVETSFLGGGCNNTAIDNVVFTQTGTPATPPFILKGAVSLNDYAGDTVDNMTLVRARVRVTPAEGGTTLEETFDLDASGGFTFVQQLMPGDYDVAIKTFATPEKVFRISNSAGTSPYVLTASLNMGDADGNNTIDSTDLSIILKNMD